MLTLIITRLAVHDHHDDGPYLAFTAVLLDLVVTVSLGTILDLKVGGVALALAVIGWVIALALSNTGTRSDARHLNRKAPR